MMMNDEWWRWRRCWTGWEWWRWWRCSIMIDGVWWWLIMTDDDEVQVVRRCSSRNWQQFFGKKTLGMSFLREKNMFYSLPCFCFPLKLPEIGDFSASDFRLKAGVLGEEHFHLALSRAQLRDASPAVALLGFCGWPVPTNSHKLGYKLYNYGLLMDC